MILEERLTEKVKHRKQLTIKVIIHESTIKKIKNETDKLFLDKIINIIEGKNKPSPENFKYIKSHKLLWDGIFEKIPKVKLDNRLQIGDYYVFENKNFLIKVRNPNRLKDQIVELCLKN